jgi:hypothetical protein
MNRRSIGFQLKHGRVASAFSYKLVSHGLILSSAFALLLAASHSAVGATINYANPAPGATVLYTDVSESSLTDPVPLFGAPSVAGDSIDFNPQGFGAFASNGGVDITDGQLLFKVTAKPTFAINAISFAEAGITTLTGLGSNVTHTDVSANGNLDIYEVDGVGINTVKVPIHLLFTPLTAAPPALPGDPPGTSGTFQLVADAGLGLSSLPWTGAQLINLNQILTNKGIQFTKGATKIGIDLDNGLIAQSELGTLALIDKKDFGGVSITINPPGGGPNGPEPTSLVLACLGFLGLAGARYINR